MPRLSCYAIRTALLQLLLGGTIGGLLLANKAVSFWPWLWSLRTTHIHLMLVGWTMQLAFGVAFWILPRISAHGERGRESLACLTYLALNAGVAGATAGSLGLVPFRWSLWAGL